MIIFIALLWFSAVGGMEQEIPTQQKNFSVPSLLAIAQRAVCSHIIDKKITIDDVQQLPPHEQELIQSLIMSEPKEVKSGDFFALSTITPDHRYVLVTNNQGLLRLDLCTNQTTIVGDLKENTLPRMLSPSGNLIALLSSEKIWIKNIAQNKVIAEKSIKDTLGALYDPRIKIYMLHFIGEKTLILNDYSNTIRLSVEKELEVHGHFKDRYVGMLPTAQEYITYTEDITYTSGFLSIIDHRIAKGGIFSKITANGEVKNATVVKNLISISHLEPAIYEPDMLIAYEEERVRGRRGIEVVSLKGWPAIVTPLMSLLCGGMSEQVVFANRGQWLIVVRRGKTYGYKFTIWDWQHNQRLYTHKSGEHPIYSISCTDYDAPYPCLFQAGDMLYSFDPIKAVAAAMLFPSQLQKTIATSNANNVNNNNNNVSNDNGPKPKTSKKTSSKQDSREKRHKRPKK